MNDPDLDHRPIRSFVRREGRLTPGQRRALAELLPRYGVEPGAGPLDFTMLFGHDAPPVLDIGFGDGDALAAMAAADPARGYLGVEVYRPGVGRLLRRLDMEAIGNVRVICADAVEVLRRNVPEASLAGVHLFFPDPWPKKRHHKRRMVQPGWVALVASRLTPGGGLHLATDCADYAGHMLETVSACAMLHNPNRGFAPDRGPRPETKFERRGRRRGHGVWDLTLRRRPTADGR